MSNNTVDDALAYGRTHVEIGILATTICILICLSVLGNLAVIVAIYKSHQLRDEISNRLTINLAITDLVNGAVVMTSSLISTVSDGWDMGSLYCDLICCVNYCLIIVSMLTLFFISLDRYQAIIHPLLYTEIITSRRITMMISYTWVQGLVFCVIPAMLHWVEYDYHEAICAIQWHKERDQAIFYVVAAFILCFLMPGLALGFCYCKILKEVKKKSQVHPSVYQNNQDGSISKKKKYSTSSKAVRSLLIIVCAYFICMTPFSVTKLIKVSWENKTFLRGSLNTAASVIAFCSSAINPLIYGIFRRDFRAAYKRLICKVKQGGNPSNITTAHATEDDLDSSDH
ncbi:hypothetical protein FSP39_000739 [Pinctada imbricata]|uniref:G-protein coupled receptors family 1 profile domain-containing protein n=1 Tax=Pinctada imbricata TaxID=66713 RepID=A0AA88Y1L6_PINIB|nr:hypothetical protein FSP39_000739 [Pinctada imbricata]